MAKKTKNTTSTTSNATSTTNNGYAAKKRVCPVSRQRFIDNAEPIVVVVNGSHVAVDVKEFKPDSEGKSSFGWYAGGKINVLVDGVLVPVQVGINLTCIGSKEAADE